MRINIYSQELTKEVTTISKVAADTGTTYHGIRLYLHSPDLLHHTKEDDDRSAITFWIPHAESFTPAELAQVFRKMAEEVERVENIVQRNDGPAGICGVTMSYMDQSGKPFAVGPCNLSAGHCDGKGIPDGHSDGKSNWGG